MNYFLFIRELFWFFTSTRSRHDIEWAFVQEKIFFSLDFAWFDVNKEKLRQVFTCFVWKKKVSQSFQNFVYKPVEYFDEEDKSLWKIDETNVKPWQNESSTLKQLKVKMLKRQKEIRLMNYFEENFQSMIWARKSCVKDV